MEIEMPPVKGAMMKQWLRLDRHGEAVGNAAVPLRMKLYALSQTLVISSRIWCISNGHASRHEENHDNEKGSKVFHGFRGERDKCEPCLVQGKQCEKSFHRKGQECARQSMDRDH